MDADRIPTQDARALNPKAGDHEVAADPELVAACRRAIEQTYAQYPYYDERYGERGRNFSSSDSGWLVVIGEKDDEHALDQVRWLSRLLASRGMPRLLIETHLGHLADEVEGLPDETYGRAAAARLRGCAAALRAERESAVGAQVFERLEREFDAAAPADEVARLPHTGRLITAAVADERAGLPRAVESLMDWLADGQRFSAEWVRVTQTTLANARIS